MISKIKRRNKDALCELRMDFLRERLVLEEFRFSQESNQGLSYIGFYVQ